MVIQLGPLPIRLYGILLMLGAVAGTWVASRQARRRGEKPDLVWDGLIWVLVGGILGARLWHILTPPPSMVAQGLTAGYYLTHPLAALAIWQGGLGIPGAVIGGVAGLYGFARRRSLRFGTWLDIAAPGLALGQAIGRWGNFVNQGIWLGSEQKRDIRQAGNRRDSAFDSTNPIKYRHFNSQQRRNECLFNSLPRSRLPSMAAMVRSLRQNKWPSIFTWMMSTGRTSPYGEAITVG